MTETDTALEALPLAGRRMKALVARGNSPAVAINHGNPGVPEYLRRLIRRLAAAGFTSAVLAGDGALEPRPQSGITDEERAEWRTREFADRYLAATGELVELLREEHSEVAMAGFCGGGWQAVRLAAEGAPISRIAAFHAALRFPADDPREDLIDLLPRVRSPLQFHFGGADKLTPAADIDVLRGEVDRLGLRAEIHLYPGAGHGFLDPDEHGEAFDVAAAELAVERLVRFLGDGR